METHSSKYTFSTPTAEDFFIRKFNDDWNVTSKQLRYEEEKLLSNLWSTSAQKGQYHIQDFLALCRGKMLVGPPFAFICR